jgi:tRNA 2-selenouridine synthase
MKKLILQTSHDLTAFSAVIDVRSPCEFAEDHLPGAINLPVLSDDQRAEVGTNYAADEFGGRRQGAAYISVNIAAMLQGGYFATKPRTFQPLIYCWRGGQRSQSLCTILNAVGWRATLLQGGYKAYRRLVVQCLAELPEKFSWRVITGFTGAGKSRLLRHLHGAGHQVLDLEDLAAHRGSLLGNEPTRPQPSQKAFETAIWEVLEGFSPERPVYVESESRRVGRLRCPDELWAKMVGAPVIELVTESALRASMLLEDYGHFVDDPQSLASKLPVLAKTHGVEQVAAWQAQVAGGAWLPFVESLLAVHYDPAYLRAGKYPAPTHRLPLLGTDAAAFTRVMQALLEVEELATAE